MGRRIKGVIALYPEMAVTAEPKVQAAQAVVAAKSGLPIIMPSRDIPVGSVRTETPVLTGL